MKTSRLHDLRQSPQPRGPLPNLAQLRNLSTKPNPLPHPGRQLRSDLRASLHRSNMPRNRRSNLVRRTDPRHRAIQLKQRSLAPSPQRSRLRKQDPLRRLRDRLRNMRARLNRARRSRTLAKSKAETTRTSNRARVNTLGSFICGQDARTCGDRPTRKESRFRKLRRQGDHRVSFRGVSQPESSVFGACEGVVYARLLYGFVFRTTRGLNLGHCRRTYLLIYFKFQYHEIILTRKSFGAELYRPHGAETPQRIEQHENPWRHASCLERMLKAVVRILPLAFSRHCFASDEHLSSKQQCDWSHHEPYQKS